MKCLTPLVLAAVSLAAAPAMGANCLANGGFEGDYDAAGLAPGWRDNSYSSKGPIQVRYSRETENVHGGAACQKVACTRIGYLTAQRKGHAYHGAQQMLAVDNVPLRKGSRYRVRVALRADAPLTVEVLLRQRPEPWTRYVSQTTAIGARWREVEYVFTSGVEDPTAAFFVRFEYLGTLWVDDASVEEFDTAQLAALSPPPTPGNLLHNGDFLLNRANWSGERGWNTLHDAIFTVDRDQGNPCLKAEVAAGLGKGIISDPVPITPGRPVRVSCRVRAAVPTEVRLSAVYHGAKFDTPAYCRVAKQVGSAWETLEAAGDAGFRPGEPHAYVTVVFTGPGPIWVDDVVLRQDDGEALPPATRAAIVPDRYPMGLYHDGEKIALQVVCAAPGADRPALKWRVEDYRGAPVLSGTWKPAAGTTRLPMDVSRLPRGYYHAVVEWRQGGRDLRNESTFCILPPAKRTGPAASSPFGGHFQISPLNTTLARAVGIRWIRLWPPTFTLWETVEPQRGKWHWPDAEVQRLVKEGFSILGMLETPPAWAKYGDATRWQDWENYVAAVVEHYRDSIHVWEVENEPNLQWWWLEKPEGGRRALEHLEHLKHSYPVVKRVAPEATVYGGCVGGDFSADADSKGFTEELIAAGGLGFMDVLSFHYYHSYAQTLPLDEMPDPISSSIARMKERMRAAGREIPIVNSEGGTFNPAPVITYRPCALDNLAPIPGRDVARLMVRQYITQWAAGVDRFFYYNCFIDGSPVARAWDSFVEGDGQPRPTVAAYAAMTWLLDGATFDHTERAGDSVWLHHFRTGRGRVVAAWSRTGTTATHTFPGAARAWDMVGRELRVNGGRVALTPDPVYALISPEARR